MVHVCYIDVRDYFLAKIKPFKGESASGRYANACRSFGVDYIDFTRWIRSDFAEEYTKHTPENLILLYKLQKG